MEAQHRNPAAGAYSAPCQRSWTVLLCKLPAVQSLHLALMILTRSKQAVTLEHVPKAIAFDTSSAARQVAVLGFHGQPGARGTTNSSALLTFAYDLNKGGCAGIPKVKSHLGCCDRQDHLQCFPAGPVQTFPVTGGAGGKFDHIRFQVPCAISATLAVCPDCCAMCL
jgi:hypothetical protein